MSILDKTEAEQAAIAARLLADNPDHVPCVLTSRDPTLAPANGRKLMLPRSASWSHVHRMIRGQIVLGSNEALFVFVDGALPVLHFDIGAVYAQHKRASGLLVVELARHETFG